MLLTFVDHTHLDEIDNTLENGNLFQNSLSKLAEQAENNRMKVNRNVFFTWEKEIKHTGIEWRIFGLLIVLVKKVTENVVSYKPCIRHWNRVAPKAIKWRFKIQPQRYFFFCDFLHSSIGTLFCTLYPTSSLNIKKHSDKLEQLSQNYKLSPKKRRRKTFDGGRIEIF